MFRPVNFSFYLELYHNQFNNLLWSSKLKFSFRGLREYIKCLKFLLTNDTLYLSCDLLEKRLKFIIFTHPLFPSYWKKTLYIVHTQIDILDKQIVVYSLSVHKQNRWKHQISHYYTLTIYCIFMCILFVCILYTIAVQCTCVYLLVYCGII